MGGEHNSIIAVRTYIHLSRPSVLYVTHCAISFERLVYWIEILYTGI